MSLLDINLDESIDNSIIIKTIIQYYKLIESQPYALLNDIFYVNIGGYLVDTENDSFKIRIETNNIFNCSLWISRIGSWPEYKNDVYIILLTDKLPDSILYNPLRVNLQYMLNYIEQYGR